MIDIFLGFFRTNLIYPLILPGLCLGIISIIFSTFIPTRLVMYKIPALVFGIIIVLFFTFYSGKYSQEQKYIADNAKITLENSIKQTKSAEITTRTVIKYVDRIKYIETKKLNNDNAIEKIITPEINSKYPNLPNAAVRVLDDAAQGRVSDSSGVDDARPPTADSVTTK